MEMVDRLAAIPPAIEHEPVAVGDPEISNHIGGHQHEVPDERRILRCEGSNVDDWPLGDDEEVDGCLRVDVMEHQAPIVVMNDPGRNTPGDDFREDRVGQGITPAVMARNRTRSFGGRRVCCRAGDVAGGGRLTDSPARGLGKRPLLREALEDLGRFVADHVTPLRHRPDE